MPPDRRRRRLDGVPRSTIDQRLSAGVAVVRPVTVIVRWFAPGLADRAVTTERRVNAAVLGGLTPTPDWPTPDGRLAVSPSSGWRWPPSSATGVPARRAQPGWSGPRRRTPASRAARTPWSHGRPSGQRAAGPATAATPTAPPTAATHATSMSKQPGQLGVGAGPEPVPERDRPATYTSRCTALPAAGASAGPAAGW